MDDLQDRDWLDEQLAASAYLPDDGFTTRVVASLPNRPAASFKRRALILSVAIFASICLVASQLVPIFKATVGLVASGSMDQLVGSIATLLHQPMSILIGGAAIAVVSVCFIPFLRRWA